MFINKLFNKCYFYNFIYKIWDKICSLKILSKSHFNIFLNSLVVLIRTQSQNDGVKTNGLGWVISYMNITSGIRGFGYKQMNGGGQIK